MLESADSALYGKKNIIRIRGLMSTRESIKIRIFSETAICDMEYVIGAYLRKINLHVSINDTLTIKKC